MDQEARSLGVLTTVLPDRWSPQGDSAWSVDHRLVSPPGLRFVQSLIGRGEEIVRTTVIVAQHYDSDVDSQLAFGLRGFALEAVFLGRCLDPIQSHTGFFNRRFREENGETF